MRKRASPKKSDGEFMNHYCVVPENIQTPTTEGIGNSRGVGGGGGGQRLRKFQKGGGLDHKITFQGVNIIFHFFQKRFGCNFKGIRLTTTRFIACSCIRPPLLVTSLPQNINACNTSRCVSRSISRVAILPHEAQAIHCNHFKM